MALVLTEEQNLLRDSARGFIADKAPVAHLRHLRDTRDATGFSRDLWREFADMGFAGVIAPEAQGGLGLGPVEAGVIMEEIGRNLTPSPFFATALVGASALKAAGGPRAEALLAKIASGDLLLALAVDEGAKHRPGAMTTQAQRSGNGFVLNGAKSFVVDGHAADLLLVAARLGDTVDVFMVDPKAAGVSVERTIMTDAHNAARVTLDNVALDADAALGAGERGAAILETALNVGRAGSAAELCGVGAEAFARTTAYLKERKQFGRLIGEFQALQHRAAHLYCELEIAQAVTLKALQALAAAPDKAGPLVSLAKARACAAADLAVREAVQMHGGIGMTDAVDIGLFMKRARVAQELFGDERFHADRLARLRGY
ncbi:MAG: acyl-CoA dehydrogenase family protein [Hyphomicrobiales bacterium]|nr:acyl-CoA dehydrogenase family protein [Hyphomicrobiales bacterium]